MPRIGIGSLVGSHHNIPGTLQSSAVNEIDSRFHIGFVFFIMPRGWMTEAPIRFNAPYTFYESRRDNPYSVNFPESFSFFIGFDINEL